MEHLWLEVTHGHALRFFFEHLRDVSRYDEPPEAELLYNASVLAHFASTSTASLNFPSTPRSLQIVFDLYVMDRSQHTDPDIMEVVGSQCLFLTGFFGRQLAGRHNLGWYSELGAGYYWQAACSPELHDPKRAFMMGVMAERFDFWRRQYARLARELRELPLLLNVGKKES